MNKPKICFIIPSVKSGGIETYLLRFLKHYGNSMEMTVLVRNNFKGELYDAYKVTGANLIFKPLGYFNPKAIWWYYQFFKKEKFETICDFNANFGGIPICLGKFAKVQKRIAFYRQSEHHFKKSIGRLVYTNCLNKLVYKYSTSIYSNSMAGLKFFFPDKYSIDPRFKVIRNGIDIDDFSNSNISKNELRKKLDLPKDKFIIGHTGRFAKAKNHFFLLDVASKLIAQEKNIYFVLIGNNTDKLLPYITKLGIEDNIQVLGYKSNIPDYLKSFDMYFFPSITEGQPNALIEAMVAGIPIAASNIAPIIECLPADRLDCLINPYDVPTTVIKLLEIKKNPDLYLYNEYASKNFDAKIQFKIFRENL